MTTTKDSGGTVDQERMSAMFSAGAHYGYSKSRRHPTTKQYIFGAKDRVEIIDLEKTSDLLDKAKAFMQQLGSLGKVVLFVGGKNEAQKPVRDVAEKLGMPYVSGRWIGGTLTNFSEIKKRVERLETLRTQRDRGELLSKYTKKERLLIDREIDKLEEKFGGLVSMKELPDTLVIVDNKREYIAVDEAQVMGKKIVALSNSDGNLAVADYPIVANDSARASITFFMNELGESYLEGTKTKKKETKETKDA